MSATMTANDISTIIAPPRKKGSLLNAFAKKASAIAGAASTAVKTQINLIKQETLKETFKRVAPQIGSMAAGAAAVYGVKAATIAGVTTFGLSGGVTIAVGAGAAGLSVTATQYAIDCIKARRRGEPMPKFSIKNYGLKAVFNTASGGLGAGLATDFLNEGTTHKIWQGIKSIAQDVVGIKPAFAEPLFEGAEVLTDAELANIPETKAPINLLPEGYNTDAPIVDARPSFEIQNEAHYRANGLNGYEQDFGKAAELAAIAMEKGNPLSRQFLMDLDKMGELPEQYQHLIGGAAQPEIVQTIEPIEKPRIVANDAPVLDPRPSFEIQNEAHFRANGLNGYEQDFGKAAELAAVAMEKGNPLSHQFLTDLDNMGELPNKYKHLIDGSQSAPAPQDVELASSPRPRVAANDADVIDTRYHQDIQNEAHFRANGLNGFEQDYGKAAELAARAMEKGNPLSHQFLTDLDKMGKLPQQYQGLIEDHVKTAHVQPDVNALANLEPAAGTPTKEIVHNLSTRPEGVVPKDSCVISKIRNFLSSKVGIKCDPDSIIQPGKSYNIYSSYDGAEKQYKIPFSKRTPSIPLEKFMLSQSQNIHRYGDAIFANP